MMLKYLTALLLFGLMLPSTGFTAEKGKPSPCTESCDQEAKEAREVCKEHAGKLGVSKCWEYVDKDKSECVKRCGQGAAPAK